MSQADKGNNVAASKNIEYVYETLSFINAEGYKVLKRNPIEIYQQEVKLFQDISQHRHTYESRISTATIFDQIV